MSDTAPTFTDPRLDPDYDPAYLPLCDGGPPPPLDAGEAGGAENEDRVQQRQIEFLSAYYRLNRLHAQLMAIKAGTSVGVGVDRASVLKAIKQATEDRDALERRYEPEGFMGDPVMEGISYRNIEFTHALKRDIYRPSQTAASSSSFSLFLPMPPPDVDMEQWVREHLSQALGGALPQEVRLAIEGQGDPVAP